MMNNANMVFALGQMQSARESLHFDGSYIVEIDGELHTLAELVEFWKEKHEEENYKENKNKQQSANEKKAESKSGVEVIETEADAGTEDRPSDKKATEQKCELPSSLAVKRRRRLSKS